jgi:ribosome-binding factor A
MRRIERVNSLIMQEVSLVLERDINDPRLGFVTITRAEVSSDLRRAKVFFTVHSEANITPTLEVLNHARGFIQRVIGERISLRYTPKLTFFYDDTLERFERLENILHLVKEGGDAENL